tara:strand:+ start:776 stop:928 length:153 start_codon:yes stop_codon:yes gene_type:complete
MEEMAVAMHAFNFSLSGSNKRPSLYAVKARSKRAAATLASPRRWNPLTHF